MERQQEHRMERPLYPFSAIVGQEEMKRALLLNLIYPQIGGVLIRGEKGTAKSTAVRALADVTGPRQEVEGCIYSCDPQDPSFWCQDCRERSDHPVKIGSMRVVNLPVSATEDRVVGTLDMEYALTHGVKKFEPGILAEANRNILYVDEVNLLEDHIVDVLLDAAAMGVNSIEREGVSFSHPSRFVLVGTMNPEEGDLRPQLLDRFGLVVDVKGEPEIDQRVEIIRRRLAYEADGEDFVRQYESAQTALRTQIKAAQQRLPEVTWSENALTLTARISLALDVDGHRADITMLKTAAANAAFAGRTQITKSDLLTAARLALPHRMRRTPFEESSVDLDGVEDLINDYGEI